MTASELRYLAAINDLDDQGKGARMAAITDYLSVVEFIGEKLIKYCNTPKELAFDEAIGAACSLGGESRSGVLAYVKSKTAE